MIGSIILLIVLIFLNAIFASAEIAVISMNDAKLKKLTEEGNKKAIKLTKLTEQPARFPVFRRSTRKFPALLFFSFFVSSSVPRFFLYLQQIFNALSGLFLLEKFF